MTEKGTMNKLINKARIKILAAVVLLISILLYGSICYGETGTGQMRDSDLAPNSNMEKAAENKYLVLYINKETTEIAVQDKANGTVWYSNPQDRSEDAVAGGGNKLELGSQLSIKYYNSEKQIKIMDNFNESIAYGQFEISNVKNGVRVQYKLGKAKVGKEVLPRLISKERFEKLILDKLDGKEKSDVKRQYRLISLDDAYNDEKKAEMIKKYKNIQKNDLYEIRDISEFVIIKVKGLLDKAGYTKEDLAYDNEENGLKAETGKDETFTIPVEYSLEEDNLIVRIPCSEIVYPKEYPLCNIQVLKYFGAANNSRQGYIFVPDGSGALIYLNNGKILADSYNSPVYGDDKSIYKQAIEQYTEQTYLPVFGLKQGDDAVFAVIEQGDALANITADVSGRLNSYNYVCSEFKVTPIDEIYLGGQSSTEKLKVFQNRIYNGDIKIRYAFLKGEQSDYTGMAQYYREYLVDGGAMKKLEPQADIPFNLEVIGNIYKNKSILGISVKVQEPLTTYSQTVEIVKELKDGGVGNIRLKYNGWFNKGVKHTLPVSISPERKLGGRRAFMGMLEFFKANGIEFYPDVGIMEIYRKSIGVNLKKIASRFMSRNVAHAIDYSLSSMDGNIWGDIRYIASPLWLGSIVDKFMKSFVRYDSDGISLRDMGNEVNSDFREDKTVDRQEARDVVVEQMKKIHGSGVKVMINGGNGYTFPYVDSVLNIPLDSSKFNITDEAVPFFQIVLHGYVDYAGEPVNLAQDYRRNILKSIETGAGIYYKWIYKDSSILKDTEFSYMYSVNYKVWLEDALKLYKEVNGALRDVQDQRIVGHEKLGEGVYRTTYENGKAVIVNYNKEPVNIDGTVVDSRDYRVLER